MNKLLCAALLTILIYSCSPKIGSSILSKQPSLNDTSFGLTFTPTSFGQTFEGIIIYKNVYKSKMPKVSSRKLTKMAGSAEKYFIKGGNYKSVMSGSSIQWQLYLSKENKIFNKMVNSDILFWIDGYVNKDTVTSTEIHKEATEILGYKCDEVILTCKSGIQKYYYTSRFPVDSKLFINDKYGNWYDFLSIANAVPLKSIIENDQFTLESTAVEIKEMKLDSSVFELLPNAQRINITNDYMKSPHMIAKQNQQFSRTTKLSVVKFISSFIFGPLLL